MLQLVEIAGRRVAARGLPALDHRARLVVELAGDLGVEAEAVEPSLHVAALAAVEPDLVLGDLARILGEGRRIDAGCQVTGRCRGAILERGYSRQRQRLELAVGIVGDVGVEFLRLVGILDRTPELELDVIAGGIGRCRGRGRRAGRRRRCRGGGGCGGRIEVDGANQVGMPPGQFVPCWSLH